MFLFKVSTEIFLYLNSKNFRYFINSMGKSDYSSSPSKAGFSALGKSMLNIPGTTKKGSTTDIFRHFEKKTEERASFDGIAIWGEERKFPSKIDQNIVFIPIQNLQKNFPQAVDHQIALQRPLISPKLKQD